MKELPTLQLHLSFFSGPIGHSKKKVEEIITLHLILTISEPGLGEGTVIHPCGYVHSTHKHLRQAQVGKENFSDHSEAFKVCRSRPTSSSSSYLVRDHGTKHNVASCKAGAASTHS